MHFSEMDYAFLDQKPELRRKGKKGRRHAGEALIQRQISNQAYFVKKWSVITDKQTGKVSTIFTLSL